MGKAKNNSEKNKKKHDKQKKDVKNDVKKEVKKETLKERTCTFCQEIFDSIRDKEDHSDEGCDMESTVAKEIYEGAKTTCDYCGICGFPSIRGKLKHINEECGAVKDDFDASDLYDGKDDRDEYLVIASTACDFCGEILVSTRAKIQHMNYMCVENPELKDIGLFNPDDYKDTDDDSSDEDSDKNSDIDSDDGKMVSGKKEYKKKKHCHSDTKKLINDSSDCEKKKDSVLINEVARQTQFASNDQNRGNESNVYNIGNIILIGGKSIQSALENRDDKSSSSSSSSSDNKQKPNENVAHLCDIIKSVFGTQMNSQKTSTPSSNNNSCSIKLETKDNNVITQNISETKERIRDIENWLENSPGDENLSDIKNKISLVVSEYKLLLDAS